MKRNERCYALLLSVSVLLTGCGSMASDTAENISEAANGTGSSESATAETVYVSTTENSAEAQTANASEVEQIASTLEAQETEDTSFSYTLTFAGDINFDDTWATMVYYHSRGDDIHACIDDTFMDAMNDADVMWINNEFAYSDGGSPMPGKMYTFRADPDNVQILQEMGVDVVGLANNHIYDYGKEAFLDTLDTLEGADILYGGAGRNLKEASEPVYVELGDLTIAYVAATRAEKYVLTPAATGTEPGVLRCYDTTLFKQVIAEAAEHADYVIALPHWGTEYSTVLEEAQTESAREYIDAGADIIIGAHTHCLQGIEYYGEVPIIYSLGNFWFNEKTLDTMLVQVELTGEGETISDVQIHILPGTQSGCVTKAASTAEEQEQIYNYLESISVNAVIDEAGYVSKAE